MIKMYEQVPQVYSNASRDFQYLSWLFNLVLNYSKHNSEALYNLPVDTLDNKFAELLAITLGFKIRRNYNKDQLAALANIMPSIFKYKGTITAIILAGRALLKTTGSNISFNEDSVFIEDEVLSILLPKDLVDTTLFMDLLPYIAPAGITCKIIRKARESFSLPPIQVHVKSRAITSVWLDRDLARLFTNIDIDSIKDGEEYPSTEDRKPIKKYIKYTNMELAAIKDTIANPKANIGILDTNIIPSLVTPLKKEEPSNTEGNIENK